MKKAYKLIHYSHICINSVLRYHKNEICVSSDHDATVVTSLSNVEQWSRLSNGNAFMFILVSGLTLSIVLL